MKKNWVMPQANVENFVANEYVAACSTWSVACAVPNGMPVRPDPINSSIAHGADQCGDATHNELKVNGDSVTMVEHSTQFKKDPDLTCSLYRDESHTTTLKASDLAEGITIYWVNSHDTRTWTHHGTVHSTGSSNHS